MDQAFPLPLVKFCSSAVERDIASVSIANHSYKEFFSGAGFTTDSNFKHSWLCKLGSSVGAILIGQAALFLGLSNGYAFAQEDSVSQAASSEQAEGNATGLQLIEDGSVVSNEHTVKWRIFTDNGREFFQKASSTLSLASLKINFRDNWMRPRSYSRQPC